MRSHLLILSFMSLALGDMSVRMLLRGMFEIFLPCFSLGFSWCYNLYLSLLSTLNYFCVWCKLVTEFHFFLHVAVQISQRHLLKRLFLLHFMLLLLCQILIDHRDLGSFLGSLFCSIDLCTCFYASTPLF